MRKLTGHGNELLQVIPRCFFIRIRSIRINPYYSLYSMKKIKTVIKLNLPAGTATPAPPVGPALGQHGIAIMEFIKAYNDRTKDKKGQVIPAVITVFEDRTFSFVTKLPPVAEMIKKKLGIEKGSGKAGREQARLPDGQAGVLTHAMAEEIAKEKLGDLNTDNLAQAIKVVQGTARSMGIKIE